MGGTVQVEITQRRIHETSSEEMASSLKLSNERMEILTVLMVAVQLAK